ncbi:MAG: hypothetical protein R6V21_01255 [Pelovirga sp.]
MATNTLATGSPTLREGLQVNNYEWIKIQMLFLLFLVPMALLSAFLAWRCWQIKHARVAVVMVITCIGCTLCSALLIYGMLYLYEALKLPATG